MRRLVVGALLVASAACGGGPRRAGAPVGPAGPDRRAAGETEKHALARGMLEAYRAGALLGMTESLAPPKGVANPERVEAAVAVLLTQLRNDLPNLIERLVPIYATRFSRGELAELAAFFRSRLGRRWHRLQFGPGEGAAMRERGSGVGDTSAFPLARELVVATRWTPGIDPQLMTQIDSLLANVGLSDQSSVRRYAAHFSREELARLVEFFTGSAGHRWISENPLSTSDAKREVRIWTERFTADVMQTLGERGLLPP